MVRKILIGVSLLFLAFIGYALYSIFLVPPKSPQKKETFSFVTVSYSQPSRRGRLIFGEEKDGALQPYGRYWRLGANAATEITFSQDVLFAGQPVKAGTYRMYAVPGPTTFQISLNSETGVYFAAGEPDYKMDVVKVDVPVVESPDQEVFTIYLDNSENDVIMDLAWEKVRVRVFISPQ